jgi:hypothetical protein
LSWSEVAQEVVEAYTEAQKAVGKIKPAELEQKLKSRRWRFIQPLSVGDDLSVVLKLDFRQPEEGKVKELAASLNLRLGSIRLFDHVLISEGGGYFGIGRGVLRVSTKFPKDSLLEVLKTLLT